MTSSVVQDYIRKEKFLVVAKLGEGNFGTCHKARKYQEEHIVVAIKGSYHVNETRKEAEIMSQLSHRNVVKYYSFFMDPFMNRAYITMELATMSVADLLKKRHHVSDPEARSFARDMLNGLVYLKTKSIVHRDIKPSNLLVSKHGRILICDFGIAVQLSSPDELISGFGGTPLYMPSEVHRNLEYSHPVDTYGVGAVLYELMRGKKAFDFGDRQPSSALLEEYIVEGKYDPLPPNFSPSGAALVKQLMNPSPTEQISCEDALNSSFLKDFYIPSLLQRYVATNPPRYYEFTREVLSPARLRLYTIRSKVRRVVEKVSVFTPGVTIGALTFLDVPHAVIKFSMTFADRLHYTERGIGYQLTNKLSGLFFKEDGTSMIQKIVGQSSQTIFIDKEGNGRETRIEDAVGTALEKLFHFYVVENQIVGNTPITEQQTESDVRVWKFKETPGKMVFCFSNGNVQISFVGLTMLLTPTRFILVRDNVEFGQVYTWDSLLGHPGLIEQGLRQHISNSLNHIDSIINL